MIRRLISNLIMNILEVETIIPEKESVIMKLSPRLTLLQKLYLNFNQGHKTLLVVLAFG